LIAINSPNNIDPLLQTGCFSSVVSSSTNTIAPAPHGPGLLPLHLNVVPTGAGVFKSRHILLHKYVNRIMITYL
jgi:hypothetical protein